MARQRSMMLLAAAMCAGAIALSGTASAATQLSLKLEKGKTYYQRVMIDQEISQTVMGQEQVMSFVIGLGQKWDVLDVDGQGNMRVRQTYIWSRFKQSSPMGDADYDSSLPAGATAGAEGFMALLGESYTMKLTPKGKVLDVNGVEEMVQAIGKKVPAGTDLTSPSSPLSFFLDKQGMKETEEGFLAVYPDEPVAQGASWTEKRVTKHGLAVISEQKWTLQKQEAGVATIVSTATVKSDPSAPPMDAGTAKIKVDVSGSEEGTIEMREATGLIASSRNRQQLKGQMNVGTSAQGPFNMMSIPCTFTTAVTMEMGDRMWQAKLQ